MKINIHIIWFILIVACKKDTTIQIPQEEPSLVVNSTLCLDSLIRFNLSYSQSITDNNIVSTETNAILQLYNKDTLLLETLNNSNNGIYSTTVTIAKASVIYLIKIITPKNIFWAKDSVPERAKGTLVSVDSINFRSNPNFLQIQYTLVDEQITQNYFGIKMRHLFEEYHLNDTILKEEWLDIETIDPILIEDVNSKFSKKQLLFTDKYFNNSLINLKFGTQKVVNDNKLKTKAIILCVEQYTFDAFQYFSSINEHLFYQNDPFSQPINVKGNINKAYGAFTGKSIKADTITFKF